MDEIEESAAAFARELSAYLAEVDRIVGEITPEDIEARWRQLMQRLGLPEGPSDS